MVGVTLGGRYFGPDSLPLSGNRSVGFGSKPSNLSFGRRGPSFGFLNELPRVLTVSNGPGLGGVRPSTLGPQLTFDTVDLGDKARARSGRMGEVGTQTELREGPGEGKQ